MATMPLVSNGRNTLIDIAKSFGPDGKVAQVAELLNQSNEILSHLPFIEGNLPTGNMTTQRTALPTVYKRSLNRGVPASKSKTKQIVDTCTLFEAHSKVDSKLLKLMNDRQLLNAMSQASRACAPVRALDIICGKITEDNMALV